MPATRSLVSQLPSTTKVPSTACSGNFVNWRRKQGSLFENLALTLIK
ncbi:MAG: hypothetical protein HOO87_04625 [Methyloglobulus sp.]|nr:hypothetical protein [Methyloglobulus sp.]